MSKTASPLSPRLMVSWALCTAPMGGLNHAALPMTMPPRLRGTHAEFLLRLTAEIRRIATADPPPSPKELTVEDAEAVAAGLICLEQMRRKETLPPYAPPLLEKMRVSLQKLGDYYDAEAADLEASIKAAGEHIKLTDEMVNEAIIRRDVETIILIYADRIGLAPGQPAGKVVALHEQLRQREVVETFASVFELRQPVDTVDVYEWLGSPSSVERASAELGKIPELHARMNLLAALDLMLDRLNVAMGHDPGPPITTLAEQPRPA